MWLISHAHVHTQNVEHARALLFRLEHDSPQTKGVGASSKHDDQRVDLQEKRSLLKRLQKRLDDLAHVDDEGDSGEYSDSSDDEDLLHRYAPAILNTSSGIETKIQEKPAIRTSDAQTAAAAATTSSTLRYRKNDGENLHPNTATSSGLSSGAPGTNFNNTTPFSPASTSKASESEKKTTNLLEAHEGEQNQLTESLLTLASALKQSTLSFSESLDSSNPLVDLAASALDKNVSGMDSAGRRMGALRRMTEGRGWWARLGLYGWVAALWVAAILVGLVIPKLRF